jgi:CubicO group peptidase (beta-lactamase class C family)
MNKFIKLLTIIFVATLLIFWKFSDPKNTKHSNASDLSYAITPREDDLPKLTDSYLSEKKNKIEHFVSKNWSSDFENVSFLVAQNGQIIYEKYEGYADKENNVLNSPETPLHIASVSKVITACAVLKLIDDKKIKLDDKLTSYFKGFH